MTLTKDKARFQQSDVDIWRRDGAVLLDGFFTEAEITPVQADFEMLYGDKRPDATDAKTGEYGGQVGRFNLDQFTNIDNMPFMCSPALNMLGLHPELIKMARAALGVDEVYLYQNHSWAKYTGGADFEQPFHCDFKNHTLTVPSEDVSERTINFMIYCSDVELDTGAISYVPLSDSDKVTGPNRPMFLDNDLKAQHELKEFEQRAPGKAGSIFAYGIDVFHRGVNLTRPGGHRFTLTASFKAKGNDMIGYTAWPYNFLQPWFMIFNTATPDQLSCLGVPRPGDKFWTKTTLERAQERWPDWDLTPYKDAL